MVLTTRVGLLAGAAALTLTGVAPADSTEEIQDLKARIAELETKLGGDDWLTEQRAEEIRGIVHDVLADADTRASLLSSSLQAGYDNGFTISSPDGNYLLRVNGQLQVRWLMSSRDEGGLPIDDTGAQGSSRASTLRAQARNIQAASPGTAAGTDEWRSGFENTRTKLWFSGHVFSPQWKYMVELAADREDSSDGDIGLLDAYIMYDFENGITARAGQFKQPYSRESMIDARYQLTIERSLLDSFYTAGRSQGLWVDWTSDAIRAFGTLTNGFNQTNMTWNTEDTEIAFVGRLEVMLSGMWEQFNDATSRQGEETGILIGGGFQWEREEYGSSASAGGNDLEAETIGFTVDGTIELGGANIFAAFNYRDLKEDADTTLGSVSQWGFLVQGGFFLTPEIEIYGRYEYSDPDFPDSPAGAYSLDDLSVLTFGGNYYFNDNVKFSADFGYSLQRVEDIFADNRAGWLSDTGGGSGQWIIRTQVQLLF
jgi:hypothetical protein